MDLIAATRAEGGLVLFQMGRTLSQIMRAKAVGLLEAGWSLSKVAEALGSTKRGVSRIKASQPLQECCLAQEAGWVQLPPRHGPH